MFSQETKDLFVGSNSAWFLDFALCLCYLSWKPLANVSTETFFLPVVGENLETTGQANVDCLLK